MGRTAFGGNTGGIVPVVVLMGNILDVNDGIQSIDGVSNNILMENVYYAITIH